VDGSASDLPTSECLDDYVGDDNPVSVIEAYIDERIWAHSALRGPPDLDSAALSIVDFRRDGRWLGVRTAHAR
jgi:hypothetical protein